MDLSKLENIFGERLETSEAIRLQHSHDESWHVPKSIPDAVIFPKNSDEVSLILNFANKRKIPVIPFGAGTSLEGQVHALKGGITINSLYMNKIKEVNLEDMDCKVQPGVTREDLNLFLRNTGLFFPIDPGANASIGGMCSTGASGTNTVKYGTIRQQVMGLKVVMPDGEIIKTGSRARKSSAGYDLTQLMLGSEGTLGFITEINLKLHGRPDAISAGVCNFNNLQGAVNTVIEAIQIGLPLSRIELLDEVQIRAINDFKNTTHNESPTLFIEIHGSTLNVKEQILRFEEISKNNGLIEFEWSDQQTEIEKLWNSRHNAYYAALSLCPGKKAFTTDVCVPISSLTECILETKKDIENSNIVAPIVGHVGDGNFHLILLLNPDDQKEVNEAKKINDRLVERALRMKGTSTGEHGIGIGKKDFLKTEKGNSIDIMSKIKQSIDPNNIMNPGKIF